jgi:hypothetical protein
MSHAKKVVMPAEEGVNPLKEDVKEKIYSKMYEITEIISRLAKNEF